MNGLSFLCKFLFHTETGGDISQSVFFVLVSLFGIKFPVVKEWSYSSFQLWVVIFDFLKNKYFVFKTIC